MQFYPNSHNFKFIKEQILEKLHFKGSNISDFHDWSLLINLPVQELINNRPNEADEIRFIIKSLEVIGLIRFKEGDMTIIESLTPNGCKWILKEQYHIDFD